MQPHLACPRLHRRRRADRALVPRIWDLFRIRRQREKKMMMRLVICGGFSSCIVWAVSVAALPTQTNLHRGIHDDCQNQHQGRHEARRCPEATLSVPQYSHRPLSSDPRREGAVVVYEPLQVNNAVCPKREPWGSSSSTAGIRLIWLRNRTRGIAPTCRGPGAAPRRRTGRLVGTTTLLMGYYH